MELFDDQNPPQINDKFLCKIRALWAMFSFTQRTVKFDRKCNVECKKNKINVCSKKNRSSRNMNNIWIASLEHISTNKGLILPQV